MRIVLRWLYPGLKLKRWLVFFSVGVFLVVAGLAMAIDWRVFRWMGVKVQYWVYMSTGRFIPLPLQGTLVTVLGVLMGIIAVERIIRWLVDATLPPGRPGMSQILHKRYLSRGPKIVAIGGGTGLPVLLRGLKEITSNITAIVTVADDGGSSGRLRGEFGILPPGDIRNCLVALADTEGLMDRLFLHRFSQGGGLAGHNFGNLFILAMSEITGDFEEAIRQSSQVLAIRGRVLPSTLDQVVLEAELADGTRVRGESEIGKSAVPIKRVVLRPTDCRPLEEALAAIREADAVVLGPGSLFTSIIPNLLVPGIADAIRSSRALKIYVSNVMTQPGETRGFTASEHVRAISNHAGPGLVEYCLVNIQEVPQRLIEKYADQGAEPVAPDLGGLARQGVEGLGERLITENDLVRHNPEKLAEAVMRLLVRSHRAPDMWPWEIYLWREKLQDLRRG